MTQEPALLFLNVGRRVELIRCFRTAFEELGIHGRIITTDINGLAPALYLGDSRHILPRCSSPEFLERFLDLCNKEQVNLVIPLIDPDLGVLARNRQAIEATGARLLVSDERVIQICSDKRQTSRFLETGGFPTPRLLEMEEALNQEFPLFIKPADGSASVNAFRVDNEEQLKFFAGYVPNAVIQEFAGGEEMTVDVFSGWSGNPIAAVPRKRLKVRAGEVSVGKVQRDSKLELLARQVAETLGTVGPVNIQAITSDGLPRIIEINPRFGGGCPLSMAAGLPLAKWVTKMALGLPIEDEPYEITDGLTMLRSDESSFYRPDELIP